MSPKILTCTGVRYRLAIGVAALLGTLLSAAWGPGAYAQQGVGEPSAAITGTQADAILQELKETRKLLESVALLRRLAGPLRRRPPRFRSRTA